MKTRILIFQKRPFQKCFDILWHKKALLREKKTDKNVFRKRTCIVEIEWKKREWRAFYHRHDPHSAGKSSSPELRKQVRTAHFEWPERIYAWFVPEGLSLVPVWKFFYTRENQLESHISCSIGLLRLRFYNGTTEKRLYAFMLYISSLCTSHLISIIGMGGDKGMVTVSDEVDSGYQF